LEQSRTGFEHKLEAILSKYDLETGSDKIKASSELCEMIAAYSSPVERAVYQSHVAKQLGLGEDVIKNSVERIRQKQMADYRAKQSREAQASIKNFGDRINPDSAREPRAAAAEESVLGMLLIYGEYRKAVATGTVLLTVEDFVTEFHRRVFDSVMKRHASEAGFRFELLGMEFTPDEVGRIEKMEMLRQQLTHNGPEVFQSAVGVLKDIAAEKAASGGDLHSRLAYLREKKAKLHKGKVDQK
jgi:DNA primase